MSDYLDDILTALSDVDDFIRGMYFETFSEDKKTINAVIRIFEVIGEADLLIRFAPLMSADLDSIVDPHCF